jgi:hypothetical protein
MELKVAADDNALSDAVGGRSTRFSEGLRCRSRSDSRPPSSPDAPKLDDTASNLLQQ